MWERKTQLIHCDPSLIPSGSSQSLSFLPSSFGFLLTHTNTCVGHEDHMRPGLFNANVEFRAEPWWQVSLRGAEGFYLPYPSSTKWLVHIVVKTGDLPLVKYSKGTKLGQFCMNLHISWKTAQCGRMFILKFSKINVSVSASKTNLYVKFWRIPSNWPLNW